MSRQSNRRTKWCQMSPLSSEKSPTPTVTLLIWNPPLSNPTQSNLSQMSAFSSQPRGVPHKTSFNWNPSQSKDQTNPILKILLKKTYTTNSQNSGFHLLSQAAQKSRQERGKGKIKRREDEEQELERGNLSFSPFPQKPLCSLVHFFASLLARFP